MPPSDAKVTPKVTTAGQSGDNVVKATTTVEDAPKVEDAAKAPAVPEVVQVPPPSSQTALEQEAGRKALERWRGPTK